MFKNVKSEEITIPAQMSYLSQIRDFIEHIGKKYHFHDKLVNSFKLVVDEACTNIIRHGYRDIKNGEITIKAIIRRLSLTIVIIDNGTSYDPRQANTPDLANYVDIGKKGGLGILMMRKLMDNLQYVVTERGNEFRLTKNREHAHESKIVQYWNDLNLKMKYLMYAIFIFLFFTLAVFIPIYSGLHKNITDGALNVAAGSNLALGDNIIDDLVYDNNMQLFEKASAQRNAQPEVINEIFIVDTTGVVVAWANTSKSYAYSLYSMPVEATFVDSLGRVTVHNYIRPDSMQIYDLSSEILMGGTTPYGQIHVWVDQQLLEDKVNAKKFQYLIIITIFLIAGFIALYFLIHKILAPFHYLAEWVRHVVHGKVDQDEIDIDASDEIGEIAQAFNEMTSKFRKAQVTLVEQQKLQKELQVAQEIQQMLLPSDFPKVEGYELASYYEAAKEVGGDLFDFVEVDDDSIGIIVADVSGKGVPGSLIMTMIRTALRLESRGNKNPADVLAKVNNFVADDMKRGMFVTMFYIILDSRNREIHFASAGHNPMILYRGSSKQTYYMNPSGFPVGIQLPDLNLFARKIQTDSIRLREDDILVVYTDGITEAMNANRELFREERFQESIRNNSHLDVTGFVKSINQELKSFTGGAPQNDDITFVAIKEKMMSGDVMYKIQEELFQLIEGGTKVKDALEKLRISPHQYYKYKEIIKRKGMAGLKEHLDSTAYIEKKHLSIEQKTKVFDIIRKHPDWGPKLISYELRTEEYGKERIDSDLIYSELVKLRLNTQKLRERFIEKGGKSKRLKQPGTPLMTLDGNVILDFEGAEKEVAKRQSHDVSKQMQAINADVSPKPSAPKVSVYNSTQAEEKEPPVQIKSEAKPSDASAKEEVEPEVIMPAMSEQREKTPPTYIHKQAKPFEPPTKETLVEPEVKKTPKPEKVKKVSPKKTTKKSQAESPSKKELLKKVSTNVKQDQVSKFYFNVKGDLDQVSELIKKLPESDDIQKDIHQISIVLKIISRHPNLKKLTEIKQVFEQIQMVFVFMDQNFDKLEQSLLVNGSKDLLKYIEKDNKFKDYGKLFESITMIGLVQRKLEQSMKNDKPDSGNQYDQIRQRILNKNLIEDTSLLEVLTKDKEK